MQNQPQMLIMIDDLEKYNFQLESYISNENVYQRLNMKIEQNKNYQPIFWNTFNKNELLIEMVCQIQENINSTKKRVVQKNQTLLIENENYYLNNQTETKKTRRKRTQIQTKHICNIDNCGKKYGTSISLKLHQKIKHQTQINEKINEKIQMPQNENESDKTIKSNIDESYNDEIQTNKQNKDLIERY